MIFEPLSEKPGGGGGGGGGLVHFHHEWRHVFPFVLRSLRWRLFYQKVSRKRCESGTDSMAGDERGK